MTEEELRDLVFDALDAALENGYEQLVMRDAPEDVAYDMVAYDDEIAAVVSVEDAVTVLVPMIEEWRAQ